MMIEMSRVLVLALLLSSLVMPMASAHGANDFSIIMRSSSIQPGEAEVMQNDSVTFYNVADINRTIWVDLDRDDEYDQWCQTEPWNSSSIRDECSFILDWDKWTPGTHYFDVFSNGTLWGTLNLTVLHDYHEEAGPPSGYAFNAEGSSDAAMSENNEGLRNLVIVLIVASVAVLLSRRKEDE